MKSEVGVVNNMRPNLLMCHHPDLNCLNAIGHRLTEALCCRLRLPFFLLLSHSLKCIQGLLICTSRARDRLFEDRALGARPFLLFINFVVIILSSVQIGNRWEREPTWNRSHHFWTCIWPVGHFAGFSIRRHLTIHRTQSKNQQSKPFTPDLLQYTCLHKP